MIVLPLFSQIYFAIDFRRAQVLSELCAQARRKKLTTRNPSWMLETQRKDIEVMAAVASNCQKPDGSFSARHDEADTKTTSKKCFKWTNKCYTPRTGQSAGWKFLIRGDDG